jgi:hypothetical protein
VRRVPELRFRPDRSYEHALRIEEVLSEVIPADASDDDEPAGQAVDQDPPAASSDPDERS